MIFMAQISISSQIWETVESR